MGHAGPCVKGRADVQADCSAVESARVPRQTNGDAATSLFTTARRRRSPCTISATSDEQPPQPEPAPQLSATSAQVRAPLWTLARISRSVTPWQWQTIMAGSGKRKLAY